MSILEFKDALVNPLKKTIEQHKAPTLSQFKSLDDIKVQWMRAEGLELALSHIESTYSNFVNTKPTHEVEILPPE